MARAAKSGIVAVSTVHPKLAAVLRAHALVQRVKAIRLLCLYLAVIGGGLAWIRVLWPDAPVWLATVARLGWPACLIALLVIGFLEWAEQAHLERLLADERGN